MHLGEPFWRQLNFLCFFSGSLHKDLLIWSSLAISISHIFPIVQEVLNDQRSVSGSYLGLNTLSEGSVSNSMIMIGRFLFLISRICFGFLCSMQKGEHAVLPHNSLIFSSTSFLRNACSANPLLPFLLAL